MKSLGLAMFLGPIIALYIAILIEVIISKNWSYLVVLFGVASILIGFVIILNELLKGV